MIADMERIAADYLREQGFRVVTQNPSRTNEPWVRVTQLSATATSRTMEIDRVVIFMLQLDCYAGQTRPGAGGAKIGGPPEARTLARQVREALLAMPEESFGDAVISRVTFNGHARIPDPDGFEPARERVALTASITAHALQA